MRHYTEHGFNCILTTPTTNLPSNNYQLKVTSTRGLWHSTVYSTPQIPITVTRKLVMGPNLWSDSNTQKQRTYRNNISRKNIVRWRYKLVPGLLYSMCIFVSQICQLGSQLCVLNTTYINIHQTPYSHTAQQNMLAWHHHNFIPACTSIHYHQPRAACSKMAKSPFRDIHLTAMAYHHVQSDLRRSRLQIRAFSVSLFYPHR